MIPSGNNPCLRITNVVQPLTSIFEEPEVPVSFLDGAGECQTDVDKIDIRLTMIYANFKRSHTVCSFATENKPSKTTV